MKNIPLLFFTSILLLIICNSSCKKTFVKEEGYIYTDSNRFAFSIPVPYEDYTNNELGYMARKANPDIIFMAGIKEDTAKNSLVSLLKYPLKKKTKIEYAFYDELKKNMNSIGGHSIEQTITIDFGLLYEDNKYYRSKVTGYIDKSIARADTNFKEFNNLYVCNIYFYFMKNDFDDNIYVLKIPTLLDENFDKNFVLAKQIAKTVKFPEI